MIIETKLKEILRSSRFYFNMQNVDDGIVRKSKLKGAQRRYDGYVII